MRRATVHARRQSRQQNTNTIDAGFHGNSKQRNVADPNGDAEVVSQPVLKNESSGHGIKGRKMRTAASVAE